MQPTTEETQQHAAHGAHHQCDEGNVRRHFRSRITQKIVVLKRREIYLRIRFSGPVALFGVLGHPNDRHPSGIIFIGIE